MTEAFNTALMLLVVGMLTVFTILSLIVLLGKLLIRLVNKYMPEAVVPADGGERTTGGLNKRTIAAIVATVDILTNGKGKVESIRKSK